MTQASDRVMSRIMALLERAEHPTTPKAEADACREKAEALMAQHMIDRLDLAPEEKSKIVSDTWDLHTGDNIEFGASLSSLMQSVLRHCNVRVNPSWTRPKDENGKADYGAKRYTIVGFPEDIGYAERIWFRVFKEFMSNLSPRWDTSASINENAYNLARANLDWQQIVLMANDAGDERIPVSILEPPRWEGDTRRVHVKGNRPLIRAVKILRDAYKAECDEREEPYEYTRGNRARGAYRTSFARSFNNTIGSRLTELRESAKETVSDRDKFALALVDTKEQVDAEFYRLFPEYDPEVRRRQQAAADAEAVLKFLNMTPEEQAYVIKKVAEEDARWARAGRRARFNYGRVRENPYDNVEMSAWKRGRSAAQKVNLRDDGEVKRQDRKEIK